MQRAVHFTTGYIQNNAEKGRLNWISLERQEGTIRFYFVEEDIIIDKDHYRTLLETDKDIRNELVYKVEQLQESYSMDDVN
ncbi:hypothetical protein ADIAL_2157 [Alkalibacterium sp. AK22]|nr:hypothetical protein ADIAL_2157 [Alkalibacterium sp. AK22]